MVAGADRRFFGREGVRILDVRGLKLWLFERASVVIRFKKHDEDGRSRNYPTKQARAYDRGKDLPGLPAPAARLSVGYLLDATGTEFIRTQVARPLANLIGWCAAIIPPEERRAGGG